MKGKNIVVIMSDEHNPQFMGCSGHPFIKTHLIWMRWQRARGSRTHTRPVRSACRRGRHLPPAIACTRPGTGTMPCRTWAIRKGGDMCFRAWHQCGKHRQAALSQ